MYSRWEQRRKSARIQQKKRVIGISKFINSTTSLAMCSLNRGIPGATWFWDLLPRQKDLGMPGGGAGCFFKYALECSGRMNQLIKGERGRIMLEGECSPSTTCEWLDRVCWIMQNCFKLANTAQISQVLVRNRGCSKRPTVHPPSPCTPRGRPACAKPLRRRQGTPLADFFNSLG